MPKAKELPLAERRTRERLLKARKMIDNVRRDVGRETYLFEELRGALRLIDAALTNTSYVVDMPAVSP